MTHMCQHILIVVQIVDKSLTASQRYTKSDWSEKEFRQRNEKKVELISTFFSREIFLAKSYKKVTAHACDVFRSNFFAFRSVFSHWRLALTHKK